MSAVRQLARLITDNAKQQDIEALHGKCYVGWDGSIDMDTLVGGIQDRIQMVSGVRPEHIEMKRLSIEAVSIHVPDNFTVIYGRSLSGALDVDRVNIPYAVSRFLKFEEVNEIGEWLLHNFHY